MNLPERRPRRIPERFLLPHAEYRAYRGLGDLSIQAHAGFSQQSGPGKPYSDAELRLLRAQLETARERFAESVQRAIDCLDAIVAGEEQEDGLPGPS